LRQPLILILWIEVGSSVHNVFRAATGRSVQATLKADNLGKREYTKIKIGRKDFMIIKIITFISDCESLICKQDSTSVSPVCGL
jgi:hypothetical protein